MSPSPERAAGTDRRAWALALLVGVAVLAAGALLVAGDGGPLPGEVAVVEALNAVPTAVGLPFQVVMQLGTWPAGVVAVAVVARWQRDRDPAGPIALAIAVLLAFRTDNVVKGVLERPRPSAVVEGLEVRDHIGGWAYPSGHTTMAVAIAAAVHPLLPRRGRLVVWTLAALVAVTRVHVAAHWPLDLVGGAALGTALAAVAWLAVRTLGRGSGSRRR